jgi:hypothetical protein
MRCSHLLFLSATNFSSLNLVIVHFKDFFFLYLFPVLLFFLLCKLVSVTDFFFFFLSFISLYSFVYTLN